MSKKRTAKSDPVASAESPVPALPAGYVEFVTDLKARVRAAQLKAAVTVNAEMIRLYWDLGRMIAERQEGARWGSKVIDQIGADLQREFPGSAGFSRQNIYRMRAFFLAYSGGSQIVAQAVRQLTTDAPPEVIQIPWGHNVTLFQQVKDTEARLWYAKAANEHGWSRAVLAHQIETDLYGRKGKAVSNFRTALPAATSDLARETLKDPFTFEFLTLAEDHAEAELEKGLVTHIQKFLLELGVGFSFVGCQYHLEVGGEDFYLDLLFYHLTLRRFVIFDLKAKAFTPEAVGKMNFYCSVVDDLLRHETDHTTIGIILCKSKSNLVAEYSLRDIEKPLAISTYVTKLLESIPAAMRGELDPPAPGPKKAAGKRAKK
jgi:predicted nuclease of restriction endonuclease-like (RecB) superfamily